MKGAPECIRISEFMHMIKNPELTKRLNEHVTKTMEEMMIATTAFIRGEAATASKKKGHVSWNSQDQSKRYTDKRPNFRDGGSSMEILYEHCFNRLRPEINSQMVQATTTLTGFSGETTWPLGQLRLTVIVKDATHSTKAWMNLMVVKLFSPYTSIIGRPGLKAIQAVPSTVHEMLKYPTEWGIVTICSSLLIPAECASIGTSSVTPREERTHPANFTVALHPNFPDQEVVVRGSLSDRGHTELSIDGQIVGRQMGRTMEVYVDDLVVKSHTEAEMVIDIEETFRTLRKINMKRNPKKCSFGLAEGVFLGSYESMSITYLVAIILANDSTSKAFVADDLAFSFQFAWSLPIGRLQRTFSTSSSLSPTVLFKLILPFSESLVLNEVESLDLSNVPSGVMEEPRIISEIECSHVRFHNVGGSDTFQKAADIYANP
nr:reverse transcriptase domain-containing protein [Tanacetum cinerariifolium]